jgi:hypothetical protein
MAKYVIDGATLEALGDSIRSVTGSTKKFTPDEMIEEVRNILDATTFILVDQEGNEYPAVYVDSDIVCTATANDIRKGSVAITPEGVIEGTKDIPAYHTTEGYKLIPKESPFVVMIPNYEYTKLQAIFCPFRSSVANSVIAEKVVVDDAVYSVRSSEKEAIVVANSETETIDFGFTNTFDTPYLIRYFSYKEIY